MKRVHESPVRGFCFYSIHRLKGVLWLLAELVKVPYFLAVYQPRFSRTFRLGFQPPESNEFVLL